MQAALLGADKVLALDFDPVAVKAAGENIALNRLADKVTVRNSDLLKAADMKGDIVIANIVADIILRLLPDVPNYLRFWKCARTKAGLRSSVNIRSRSDEEIFCRA